MSIIPIKKSGNPLDEFSDLYHDVKSASEHEIELAIGSLNPPKLPRRDVHPAISGFPAMGDADYAALIEDIRQNGQRKAIGMYQGMIWDGRSRYDACVELGLLPRLWIVRRRPVYYLLYRNPARFGEAWSNERTQLLPVENFLENPDWITKEQSQRKDWLKYARWKFQQKWRPRQRCAICGMDEDYSHAHHSLPLNIQYDLGVSDPIGEYDWLCPTHHQFIHRAIAALLMKARYGREQVFGRDAALPDDKQKQAAIAIFDKAEKLFCSVGGILPYGNWEMISP